VKPVPVRLIEVPTGAPTGMSVGDWDVRTGPAMLRPAAKGELPKPPLSRTTESNPARVDVALTTFTVKAIDVPLIPVGFANVTPEATLFDVPT
jgi:hypothetical protein